MKAKEPYSQPSDFTDTKLVEEATREALVSHFRWVNGMGWMKWGGKIWEEAQEDDVIEAVRSWTKVRHLIFAQLLTKGEIEDAVVKRWLSVMMNSRISAIAKLARGMAGVKAKASDFDTHRDLLNVANGVADLRTGELSAHDPKYLMTKISKGRYILGYKHPDWEIAISALDEPTRTWFQTYVGQAITGYRTPEGVLLVLEGVGSNGKGMLTTDGLLPALGDYASPASAKLFLDVNNEHSTERADLHGTRLLVAEEITEGRSLNVTAIKQIQDVGRIKARKTYKDNFTFVTSHSIFCTTNYIPVVSETDWGTWRRLARVKFSYRYVSPPAGASADWQPDGPNSLSQRREPRGPGRHGAGQRLPAP